MNSVVPMQKVARKSESNAGDMRGLPPPAELDHANSSVTNETDSPDGGKPPASSESAHGQPRPPRWPRQRPLTGGTKPHFNGRHQARSRHWPSPLMRQNLRCV